MNERRFLVKTLGCKANLYDSQLIEAELKKRGWLPLESGADEAQADLCIVNSCTVTDEADRQSRKMAQKLGKMHSGAKVVFTGCGAEVDPEGLKKVQGIDYIIGNQDKPRLLDLILDRIQAPGEEPEGEAQVLGEVQNYAQMASRHPMDRDWPAPQESFFTPEALETGESARTRAFLKVQDGCNSFCTYCVIPYGRGPSRSLGILEIVNQVKKLVSQGFREVVITGVNIGDYGTDWSEGRQPRHAELFEAILRETSIERLRVSSLDPTEITPEILNLMKSEPRFCPHFHVSLQSPHSKVLKLMKRKYAHEQVRECLESVAALPAPVGGVFVGMDVITGFPGESAEDFEWSVEALRSLPWSRLHVFPYSERSGTPATRLPGIVPQGERNRRARVLRELSFERLESIYAQALQDCRERNRPLEGVLLEGLVQGPPGSGRWWAGYTRNYLRVLVPEAQGAENELISVRPHSLIRDAVAGDCSFLSDRI